MDAELSIANELTRLWQLTAERHNGQVSYDVLTGSSRGWGLYKDDTVAVQRNCMTVGTQFHEHAHEEWEWIIISQGCLEFDIEGRKQVVSAPGSVTIPPGTRHCAYAVETTWMIGITIPPATGYPNGQSIEPDQYVA